MPIHDWTLVRPNRFHVFHQTWTVAIHNALNCGPLPTGYFAVIVQKSPGPEPDFVTLELNPPAGASRECGLSISLIRGVPVGLRGEMSVSGSSVSFGWSLQTLKGFYLVV